jgi:hypothetical protein
VSAITSLRTLLAANPSGVLKTTVYAKVTADNPTEIARAIKSLKDADQVIELGTGKTAYLVLSNPLPSDMPKVEIGVDDELNHEPVVHRVEAIEEPEAKPEPAGNKIQPRGRLQATSTSGQIALLLFHAKNEEFDTWHFMTVKEIHKKLNATTKKEVGRINTALVFLVQNGYLERSLTGRGAYRWADTYSFPFKYLTTEGKVPSPVVLLDNSEGKIPDTQEPMVAAYRQPATPDVQIVKTGDGGFAEKLAAMEIQAINDYITKGKRLAKSVSQEDSFYLAEAGGRLAAIQEIISEFEEFEAEV